MSMAHSRSLSCSFCSKSQKDVKKLIANPAENSYICEECVEQCTEILIETAVAASSKKDKAKPKTKANIPSPRSIKEFLDQYVIGQDAAKEVLSVAVYNHYKRIENPTIDGVEIDKGNLLLTGPSGVGKTLLVQTIARMLDVPLTIADATTLTEAGFIGADVEDVIARLLQSAEYDINKAERGIVFLDEIDKKSRREPGGAQHRDASGEGVQQALLKLLEGSEVMVPTGGRRGPNAELVKVNTKNILFILGGAFIGLEKVVQRAKETATGIGFGAKLSEDKKEANTGDLLRQVEPQHLIKFGMIPELIGRVPVVAVLDDLDENQLMKVLTEPKNALVKQYTKLFALDGVQLEFEPDALMEVAKIARTRKTNGRALRGVLETRLLRTQFNLPDLRDKGAEQIIISAATITEGAEPQVIYKASKGASTT